MEGAHNSQCFDLTASPKSSSKRSRTHEDIMDVDAVIELDDDDKQNDDEEFEKLLWSIDDDTLFYPLGLTNHGTNAGKTVFVTWCEDYLLNFIFKRSRRTKQINLTKVRLPLPDGESVSDVLILELNALILMHTGRVYYFSSVKSMQPVPWLNGVRCMAAAPSGFSVIRYMAEHSSLCLEVYRDVPGIGKSVSTLLQRCDITFDTQNLFNCQWHDERYTLVTQQVTASNLDFMQLLLWNEMKLNAQQCVHFFTVSGIVFALVAAAANAVEDDEDICSVDYSIQQLCSFATNVDFIRIDCAERRCLVFLQSGSIDIWYASSCIGLLHRMQHHTGSAYTHRVYAPSTRCFYCTDEEQLTQLQFSYNSELDSCHVQETIKAIPGIMACTWVDTLQHLICLSCNNIFYKITFDDAKAAVNGTTEYENLNDLYELTPARMARLLSRAQVVKELEQLPTQLHTAIEQEYVKQQLIAVIHNQHIYRRQVTASLSYTTQLPDRLQQNCFLIYANTNFCLHNNSLLALIHMRINKNELFQSVGAMWHLHIDWYQHSQLMHIPSALLQQELHIVLPLARAEAQLLPEFNLAMYAVVRQQSDFLAITFPISLQTTARTYTKLFSRHKRCITISNEYSVARLVKQFQTQISEAPESNNVTEIPTAKQIIHNFKLPASCRFSAIIQAFGFPEATDAQHFTIYFMSNAVEIAFVAAQNYITLECSDAVALCYTKLHLLLNIPELIGGNGQSNSTVHPLILQLKCDLERVAATQIQMNDVIEDDGSSPFALQKEQLRKIYTKSRSEFYKLCS